MRVAVLLEDRCSPEKCNAECWAFCPPVRNGIECIILDDSSGKPIVSEPLCIGCGICVTKCPFDALIITNLPEELDGEMTHRYDQNGFRLFRLPAPREKQVVGILGPNGMGKSTAINLLSGSIKPNLGDWTISSLDWDEIIDSFPRGELRDYLKLVAEDSVKIAVKPQYIDKLPKIFDGNARELLERVDDRGELEEYAELLAINHILDRNIGQLSGGELQRVAICATMLKEAEVYFFDEPSSYLDIHERMRIVKIIQNLAEMGKRVIVVEHDLAILDVLCDLLHVVYGERAAYGIFTPARSTRSAINAYLEGFLPEENVRIRDKPIQFLRGRVRGEEVGL
ncbi:MAG: ribosome biogenesis/translation initiation ATPase RLI, partial [Euryarchaeota archaeon]|nr:ribosome biogenesis/translation initiation ATPase RLI [Euryarchaeota archaeon]